jgi:hypothetical protein
MKIFNSFNRYINLVYIGYSVLILLILIWTLNRGVVFTDESWYLLHLKGNLNVFTSDWYEYGKMFFPENIFYMRLEIIILIILSSISMAYGINKYTSKLKFTHLLPLALIAPFIFISPVQFVPNYITLNTILFQFGLGTFLILLSINNLKLKFIWAIITGMIFSQLIFIMITNSPYIIILIIFLFLIETHRNTKIISISGLILGVIIGIISFFLFIKSFSKFILDFEFAIENHKFFKTHGAALIFKWIKDVFLYFILMIIPVVILVYLILKNNISILIKVLLLLLFTCILIYDFYNNFLEYHNISSPFCVFIILLTMITIVMFKKNYTLVLIFSLILITPFFASLGTNVPFHIRASIYIAPLLLIIYNYSEEESFRKLKWLFHLIIFVTLIKFSTKGILTKGWQRYVISAQSTKVSTIGIDSPLKLDGEKLELLKEIKVIVPKYSTVIVNSTEYWGIAYLLDYKIPYLYFNFDESQYNWYFSNVMRPKNIYLFEKKSEPFSTSMLKNVSIYKVDTLILNNKFEMNIYKIKYK